MRSATRTALTLVWLFALACGASSTPTPVDGDAGPGVAGGADAGDDAAGSGDAGADGSTPELDAGVTTAAATFGGKTIAFERAQFGVVTDTDGSVVQIELHEGGDPACPVQDSPTPLRTLILAGIKLPVGRATLTYADGVRATLIDFKGDLLAGPEPARADSVSVTIASARVGADGFVDGDFISLDIDAVYASGTVSGHVAALRCATMDSTL